MLNLITFNRWWLTGRVEKLYLKAFKRRLFKSLLKFLKDRQIISIYGLRRTGKTTLLFQLIQHILSSGTPPKHILYFSFDEKRIDLEKLLRLYAENALGNDILKLKQLYVFLDEVQKLPNWEDKLKIFYDLYPNIKFIITGSAGLQLSTQAKKNLAGRVYEFILSPLSFGEYLKFLKIDYEGNEKELFLKREILSPYFLNYLRTGGFIEIAKEKDEEKLIKYPLSLIESVIFGDIIESFKIRQPQVLKLILELIASNPGFLLDFANLSEVLKIDPRTLSNYIFALKYSLLIKLLYNFSPSRFVSERKLKKIYLSSTNFIYHFNAENFYNEEFLGKVVENFICSNFQFEYFWRERHKEVDIVNTAFNPPFPIKIKFKSHITKSDLKGVLSFCKKHNAKKAVVVTKDLLSQKEIDGVKIKFIPAWIYALKNSV